MNSTVFVIIFTFVCLVNGMQEGNVRCCEYKHFDEYLEEFQYWRAAHYTKGKCPLIYKNDELNSSWLTTSVDGCLSPEVEETTGPVKCCFYESSAYAFQYDLFRCSVSHSACPEVAEDSELSRVDTADNCAQCIKYL